MADLRIVDAPEIPTEDITGEEKLPTGGSGNYSITLDSVADYTKTKKDLADNTIVDGKVNGVRQELDAHIEDLLNPHQVTKGQIGLGNVDNTADSDKPVSNSTQSAIISAVAQKADKTYVDNQLTLKANKADVYTKSETYTKQESSDLVNSSISTALTPVNSSLDLAKRGVANRYDSSLTYNSDERVVLVNGDIVKSTIDGNANNPNVDMTGWVQSNILLCRTVSHLPTLSKSGFLAKVGGRQGGWFKYNSDKSSENDDGTILNGWERIDYDYLTLDMFDCDPTGMVEIDAKLLKLFDAQRRTGKPIKNKSGRYLLNSNLVLKLSGDVDMTGTVFKIGANFTGYFQLDRDTISTTYTDGALFNTVRSMGILPKGATKLPTAISELEGTIVEINTSQEMYLYRDEAQTRYELQRFYKHGQFSDPLYYALDLSLLTSLTSQKIESSKVTVEGFTFDETDAKSSFLLRCVRTNNFSLRNFNFIDNSTTARVTNQRRIFIEKCHLYDVDGVETTSVVDNTDNTFNYTLQINNSYAPVVKNIVSDGHGWGTVATNDSKNVTFDNCKVNRIDSHKPTQGYLKLKDCELGSWGVICSTIGDVYLSNCIINQRADARLTFFISSRTDTGGFCDGNLYIDNLTLNGTSSKIAPLIYAKHNGVLPAGSPINPVFFNKIFINGLHNKLSNNFLRRIVDSEFATSLQFPELISVRDFTQEVESNVISFDVTRFANPLRNPSIIVDNVTAFQVQTVNDGGLKTFPVYLSVINSRGSSDSNGITISNQCAGVVSVKSSQVKHYNEQLASGYNPLAPQVTYIDCDMLTDEFVQAQNSKERVSAELCRFKTTNIATVKTNMSLFTWSNCRFRTWQGLHLTNGNSASVSGITLNGTAISELRLGTVNSGAKSFEKVLIDCSTSKTVTFNTCDVVVASGTPLSTITINAKSGGSVGVVHLVSSS